MDNIDSVPTLVTCIMTNSWHALDESSLQNAELNRPFIILKPDKTNNTLSIIHNGNRMSKADLGAMERCGAKEFTQPFQAWANIISMIDRWLVVDKVTVTTKRNHGDDQYKMESHPGSGSFTVTKDVNGKPLARGTMITLFLKENQLEYLEERKIRDVVKEVPEFIKCPIYLWAEKEPRRQVDETETEIEEEVPYGCQLIREQKYWFRRRLLENTTVKHNTSDWVLCMTIKGILGDKVADVNIAAESFGEHHCRFTSKRILEISPDSKILEHLRKMMVETTDDDQQQNESDSVVKAIVLLLFDQSAPRSTTTTRPKKANWRKWSKGLSICCRIVNLTAAVLSCVASGCGGGA